MSKLKSTLLKIVNDLETKNKKPVHITDINHLLGCKGSRVGPQLWAMAQDELFKKTKQGGKSLYRLSPKGKSALKIAISGDGFLTDEEFLQWAQGTRDLINHPGGKAKPARNYSGNALSAIESIASVIDQNEGLLNTLRSIKSQIEFVLKEHDSNVSENSDI